ncbi:hypothetical protein HZU75_07940 [Chitinibacter fontanus]|uniref:Uncharacterized protein n=1 Tax=Chitinibacter fontanus TaxID=1737446 RepID=A0A7D5Z359_9NEIS|nr:hypothetical protein [Chitinibacter fontanus]QLI81461.1 hypothetical protein HZU75_07940 [Chitinibacter fontanus]
MLISAALFLAVATIPSPTSERDQLRQSEHMYWRAINTQQIDLWMGKEEVWRLTVSPNCPAWPTGNLTLVTRKGHFKRQQSIVANASDSCRLMRIEPQPGSANHSLPTLKVLTVDVNSPKGNNKP